MSNSELNKNLKENKQDSIVYEIKEGKHEKLVALPIALLQSSNGLLTLNKGFEISSELIVDSPKEKDQKIIYNGVPSQILEIKLNALPFKKGFTSWLCRQCMPRVIRLRTYFNIWGEPFTRSPTTGSILDSEKKKQVLIEKGFMDKEGFLLDKEFQRVNYKHHWIKVDVSDIDFMNAEFHAFNQSKTVEKVAIAMSKVGTNKAMEIVYVAIAAIIGVVITTALFLFNGGGI